MAFSASWQRLPHDAKCRLIHNGFDDEYSIAHLSRSGDELEEIWVEMGGSTNDLTELLMLRQAALDGAQRAARMQLCITDEEHMARTERKRKREECAEYERLFSNFGLGAHDASLTLVTSKRAHTRSSLRVGGKRADLGISAVDRDKQCRDKYVKEIVDILISIQAPTATAATRCGDVRATLSMVAAGRRASTLRARLRAWRSFSRWLTTARGESWPSGWGRLLEYLRMRASEPCGKQTILGFAYAASFWEKASGLTLTADPLWKLAVQELLSSVSGRAGGEASESARPTLVKHLSALELIVTNEEEPRWIRGYSAWKLIQAWGTLRFDDQRGIDQRTAQLEQEPGRKYLKLILTRTKTTGRGKRVEKREVAVSTEAYLCEPTWLEVGWKQITESAQHARDYLLTPPEDGLQVSRHKELSYQEASGWSRAVYRKMNIALGSSRHAAELIGQMFTEHSGRSFLPTAAMALGASDEFVKPLGGWSASPTRGYMKATLQRITLIHHTVARKIREKWGGADVIGEGVQIQHLEKYLRDHGLSSQHAEQEALHMRAFTEGASTSVYSWEDVFSEKPLESEEVTRGNDSASTVAVDGPTATTTLPEEERGYVVSISTKHRLRRLHYLGKCHRVPKIHYQDFEFLGMERPDQDAYDDYCRQCWRENGEDSTKHGQVEHPAGDRVVSDLEGSEDSEDHSSSTEIVD